MQPLDELATLLRPAGGGLYLVSTGRAEQLALQRRLYGAATDDEVDARWRATLARIVHADTRVVVLGSPSDVGAGFVRGANLGPQAIRTALLERRPDWPAHAAANGIVDIGDVFVVPQLLHDAMGSPAQLAATRAALYPNVPEAERGALPASPLSISERALELVFQLNPRAKPFVLGGDHSNAWPVVAAIARANANANTNAKAPWAIVQVDAHTDLLAERLGVKYCFATWSYHANDLLGRGGRLVQLGIRATRHPRAHWESTLDVRQFWADDCNAAPARVLDDVAAHLRARGIRRVYFSNDIDGTDERYADATGTPEPNGLEPDFVVALIRRLSADFDVIGGDVMEVAPPIQRTPDGGRRTVALAARYAEETLDALVKRAAP